MKKFVLLSICSGASGLLAARLTELYTFGDYAAEAEQRGITHASLVEPATFSELAMASLPWGLALFMLLQWLFLSPANRLLRNLSRWLALLSPGMFLMGLAVREDMLRSLLHMGGPGTLGFTFPCVFLFTVLAVALLIPFVLFSVFPQQPKADDSAQQQRCSVSDASTNR